MVGHRPLTVRLVAGAFALASGIAYLVYLLPIDARDGAITAWNLLIIPAAVYLGVALAGRGPIVAAASMAAGLVASLLWAFDYESPRLEPWWIGLAAVWWLGLGWLLRAEHRRLAWFTLVLAAATGVDFVLTLLNAPMPIYALGGFKIPLTIAWTLWLGVALLRDARWRGDLSPTGWSGATALVGGALWALFALGWTFSHGSTQDPRAATFHGLGANQFTQLLAVPALLWALSLAAKPARHEPDRSPAARLGVAVAIIGAAMVALGALLQTSIVNPDLQFQHPAVQGGWLVFVAGLVPMLTAGMVATGTWINVAVGLLSPLPVVAFFLSGASDGGVLWTITISALHAAPGLGWIALGSRTLAETSEARRRT